MDVLGNYVQTKEKGSCGLFLFSSQQLLQRWTLHRLGWWPKTMVSMSGEHHFSCQWWCKISCESRIFVLYSKLVRYPFWIHIWKAQGLNDSSTSTNLIGYVNSAGNYLHPSLIYRPKSSTSDLLKANKKLPEKKQTLLQIKWTANILVLYGWKDFFTNQTCDTARVTGKIVWYICIVNGMTKYVFIHVQVSWKRQKMERNYLYILLSSTETNKNFTEICRIFYLYPWCSWYESSWSWSHTPIA